PDRSAQRRADGGILPRDPVARAWGDAVTAVVGQGRPADRLPAAPQLARREGRMTMDFALSPEQLAFQDSVRRFARDKLADRALARAHDPAYPWEVARQISEQGLLGIVFSEADG